MTTRPVSMKVTKALGLFCALCSLVAVGACTTTVGEPKDVVSVQYDPNNYDQKEIERAALAQCRAKNYSYAAAYAAQPNMVSNGWTYKTFGCY
ncbi:hypothetical protein [Parvularcula sp. LCG005]|uniref:hypothetical protein n=1 Tax=Parvularcula sp. LCG005 TaxID=3078805 RepID=UPI0029439790|nr:hypothetical protein [Parvularcula sp. LCG005]WOI52313.1 hypothetical protein RUI03_09130 [Parvularcula sp. LCG005]